MWPLCFYQCIPHVHCADYFLALTWVYILLLPELGGAQASPSGGILSHQL